MKWWQWVLNGIAFLVCCLIAIGCWATAFVWDLFAPPRYGMKSADQWAREIYRRSEDRAFGEMGIKWLTEWIKKIQEDARR